jgi:hypothetical protein
MTQPEVVTMLPTIYYAADISEEKSWPITQLATW